MARLSYACQSVWRLGTAALGLLFTTPVYADDPLPACTLHASTDVQNFMNGEIGLPVFDHGLVTHENLAEVCFDRFCALYNNITRTPIWVAEFIDADIAKENFKREEGEADWNHREFDESENIRPVPDSAYTNSGWARGHMAASANFSCHTDWMGQTFTFSNAVPQWQDGFNSGVWSSLEKRVKNLALSGERVFVFTGPVYPPRGKDKITIRESENGCDNEIVLERQKAKTAICDENDENLSAVCPAEGGVGVPVGLYKIVHLPDDGRTFAHLISNVSHTQRKKGYVSTNDYLQTWQVSINVIEELTGLSFFPTLDLRSEIVKKAHCTQQRFR
ncbi:DNA/RNA non-specific endonuclease [uncultured Roseobacter sp.]|uniref:DNA/RNA non-specific endonuclease n=1 Tax=uncultured Roseobacter sp. TaxID=114847 RepID=UPI00262D1AC4|nr:DNA/RNA non-specific endonuclease [uncultured Roseobacter sp.]